MNEKYCDRCSIGDETALQYTRTSVKGEQTITLCGQCSSIVLEDLLTSAVVFDGVYHRLVTYPHKKDELA